MPSLYLAPDGVDVPSAVETESVFRPGRPARRVRAMPRIIHRLDLDAAGNPDDDEENFRPIAVFSATGTPMIASNLRCSTVA